MPTDLSHDLYGELDESLGAPLAEVLDRTSIILLDRGGIDDLTYLNVSPAVYQTVVRSRPKEVRRGGPMSLLGLLLRRDESLSGNETSVA